MIPRQLYAEENLYVQYGCGFCAPIEWINFDASPTLLFEKIPLVGRLYTRNLQPFPKNVRWGNIVTGLPLADRSCAGIYCSHVLEHMALEDCRKALRNTFRYLKKEGKFRLVVPDLEYFVHCYLKDQISSAASDFMERCQLGQSKRSCGLTGILQEFLGNSRHRWMWDEKALREELTTCGFRMIRRAVFGDSSDPMFWLVEDKERFENALGIECEK